MLTRLGEAGVDAFAIMKIAGHNSIAISQRYVHPCPESPEWVFEKLEAVNRRSERRVGIELGIAVGGTRQSERR